MIVPLAIAVAAVAALRGMWSPCGLSMLTQLNPVAERGRGNRFAMTAAWYVAGATVGGALLGGAAAISAWLFSLIGIARSGGTALALLAALACLVSDLPAVRWTLPLHPRQVNELWLARYRRWIYASGFGVQIGVGFATYIMTSAIYLTVALAVLTRSAAAAALIGVIFGVVRGLTVLLAGVATTPQRLRAVMSRVDAWEPTSRFACVAAESAVAGAAAADLAGISWTFGALVAVGALSVSIGIAHRRPAAI